MGVGVIEPGIVALCGFKVICLSVCIQWFISF